MCFEIWTFAFSLQMHKLYPCTAIFDSKYSLLKYCHTHTYDIQSVFIMSRNFGTLKTYFTVSIR